MLEAWTRALLDLKRPGRLPRQHSLLFRETVVLTEQLVEIRVLGSFDSRTCCSIA
jgi:hypothetical protein